MFEFSNVFVYDDASWPWFSDNRDVLHSRLDEIQRLFSFKEPVHLYFFDTSEILSKTLEMDIPEWVKGVSYGKYILLVKETGWISDMNDSMVEILVHEYIHLAITNTFASTCPTWLNEGLATVLSGQISRMDLSECTDEYPLYSSSYEDSLFYKQSAFAVNKLFEKTGKEQVLNHAKMCSDFANDSLFGTKWLPSNLSR